MFAVAPVFGKPDEVIAALCLRMSTGGGVHTDLEIARIGETGETYAFDRNGLMLSNSRFDDSFAASG